MRNMFLLVSLITAACTTAPAPLDENTRAAITVSAQTWCSARAACSHITLDVDTCTASIVASYCNKNDCAAPYTAWPELEACTESVESAAPQDACTLDRCAL